MTSILSYFIILPQESIKIYNEMHLYKDNLSDCSKFIWKIWISNVYFLLVFFNFHGLIRKTKGGCEPKPRIRNLAESG